MAWSAISLLVGFSYVSINHVDRHTGASRYYSRSPVLNLKGNWLQEAGFDYGQPVIVTV